MIKYRLTTFLPLLLSYLLLGVIPSQGANVDDNPYNGYWFRRGKDLTCTGKEDLKKAVSVLNREFFIEEEIKNMIGVCMNNLLKDEVYNQDIPNLIFDNMKDYSDHLDLTMAKNLNALNDINPMIVKKIKILSLSFLNNNDNKNITFLKKLSNIKELKIKGMIPLIEKEENISKKLVAFFINLLKRKNIKKYLNNLILSENLTALSIDLSESKNIKSYIDALILWEELNNKKEFTKNIKLPLSLNYKERREICANLEKKKWNIISWKKDLELIELIENYHTDDDISSSEEEKEGKQLRKKIEKLIKEGADVNGADVNENCPLIHAIYKNKVKIVALLIEKGAYVNGKKRYGNSSLHCAIVMDNVEMVALLLKYGANVNEKEEGGGCPLSWAIDRNNVEMVALLLKYGADVNGKNEDGNNPLFRFINVNNANNVNNVEMVALLLKSGVDVNAKDKNGYSLLLYAINNMNVAIATLLLQEGADINAKNNGRNLLDFFSGGRSRSSVLEIKRTKMATFLIDNGAQNSFFVKWPYLKVIFPLLFMGIVASIFFIKTIRKRRALKKKKNRKNRRRRTIKKN